MKCTLCTFSVCFVFLLLRRCPAWGSGGSIEANWTCFCFAAPIDPCGESATSALTALAAAMAAAPITNRRYIIKLQRFNFCN